MLLKMKRMTKKIRRRVDVRSILKKLQLYAVNMNFLNTIIFIASIYSRKRLQRDSYSGKIWRKQQRKLSRRMSAWQKRSNRSESSWIKKREKRRIRLCLLLKKRMRIDFYFRRLIIARQSSIFNLSIVTHEQLLLLMNIHWRILSFLIPELWFIYLTRLHIFSTSRQHHTEILYEQRKTRWLFKIMKMLTFKFLILRARFKFYVYMTLCIVKTL